MLKFYLVTDTHLWSVERLGMQNRIDQQCVNESGAIIDAAFEKLAQKTDSDIILIAGDLTNNGEGVNHEEMLKKLYSLKERGKRVYVITATHDYGLCTLDDNGSEAVEKAEHNPSRRELREMYNDFGFAQAIAVDEDSMSYVVQLADGYRLLALNDDGNGRSFCGYYERQMSWILEQISKAKADGQFIFAMTHHPVLPPTPIYPLFSRRDMLGDFEKTSTILADAGLRFVFTGHTHCQNIESKDTPSGNRLYDINTGALVGYPAPIRAVTIDDNNMTVATERVENFDWDLGGKSAAQYLGDHFDHLLTTLFNSMADDFDTFSSIACGFSVERPLVEKLRKPIEAAGRFLQKLTFAKAGRLFMCRGSIDKQIENTLVKDFIIEAVRNIWSGNEIYSRDTSYGKAIYAIVCRLDKLAGGFVAKLGISDFPEFVMSLIYDASPDNEAVLPLK